MISLDFEVDRSVVRRDRSFNPGSADMSLLRHSYFDMPVRFSIGDIELIDGATIPIYTMAADGLEDLRNLPKTRRVTMQPPVIGGFVLEMDGDDVIIFTPSHGGREARVPYADLLRAWEAFASKVRSFLVREFPELREHPQMGAWLRGED